MNNIYKVIWSKAKNCYVVASEIARSHTKSASGSEKIGGVARHALLALGAACAIACGGFVNVGAAESVEVSTPSGGVVKVYDANTVDSKLNEKADKSNTFTKSQTYSQGQVKKLINDLKTGEVATNKSNITTLDCKTEGLSAEGKSLTDMNRVETGALKVTGEISDGTVNTTLAKIDASMKQTETNKGDIVDLQAKTYTQQTWIGKLKDKTTEISYADGEGTKISGVTIKNGNIVGDGNSAITGLANVQTDQINGKSLAGTTVATATEVEAETLARKEADNKLDQKIDAEIANRKTSDTALDHKIDAEIANRKTSDTALDNKINKEIQDRDAADAALEGKITTLDGKVTTDIADLKAKDIDLEGKIQTNADNIQNNKKDITTIKQRTAGIDRIDATNETTIEGNVTVDNLGNVKAKGGVTADGKLNVTGASDLKGDVTLGTPNGTNTVTVNGTAHFNEAANMNKGLNVTSGDTDLKNTTVDGTLSVNKETTLKKTDVNGALTVQGEATFKDKVTMEKDLEVKGELKTDKIAMEHTGTDADGTRYNSATTITADGITHIGEVEKSGVTTKSSFTHTEKGSETYAMKGDAIDQTETRSDVTADGVKTEVKDSKGNRTNTSQTKEGINGFAIDKDGNSSTTSQTAKDINGNVTDKDGNKTDMKVTATKNSIQIQDKDGKNTNLQVNTMGSSVTEIKNGDGKTTKTEQTATDITNTAEQGTIKNNAMNIENNASGNITNNAQHGTITNNAKDIVNNATGDMTNDVGGKLTTTVAGQATENFKGGLDTTVTGAENHTVTGKQTNTVGGGQENIISGGQTNTITGDQTTTVTGDISNTAKNITNEATTKLTDKVGANTRVLDGEGITDTVGGSTFKQRIDAIMGNVKTADGESEVTQKGNEITSVVGKGEATNSRVTQKKGSLEAAVTDGTNTNDSYDVANASAKVLSGGTKVNKLQDNLDSSEKTITNGTYTTSKVQTALDITNTAKDGTITNDAKDIVNNAKNTITNTAGTSITNQVKDSKVTTDANGTTFENKTPAVSDGGATTTKINGNQITTGRVDANELGVSDKDGTNTADLSVKAGEGVKASASDGTTTGSLDVTADEVGSTVKDASGKGSTFKQRIDAIMMESKDVSITAEETLTNEAKVITNKASEVINNEAVNINNTATGIITSKASEIKNQADKLISNKVGENTWENMENGKITTSIKDGAKQNLTQSDAAGTTQSTVDGNKSTVTIQNADGLTDAVRDGAGNENGSVATATTSANTIKSGSKANTVISTADGTSFINSEAAAPVTGESGAGTAVNTTIKGNTITTGKVTMDYAEVMKDLGVRGNANITGKTTTGSLEVTGTSTLKGDVTMGSNATVKKDFTVEGNTNQKNTKVDGTLDVTQKATFGDSVSIAKDLSVGGNATIKGDVTASSYKVGDKTYISAAGINANDQKITNVADGSISEGSKDAVNGGQLYTVKNDFEGKVNKVGANAAAMANLHPMEFDPDSKWNIAAAIGNYGSETAAALGAFYRPNDDVMVNLSTAFGTGENMVGGGVSVRLGKGGNKLSREETNALKAQVADLTARMDALLSVLNPNMSKDFPDVPENHWAYEAVSRLAGNDIVQGYPDGEFHGERTMTRYEMAEIIYNALSRGAEAEKELVEEFKPELQAMAASEKATAEKAEG